MEEKSNNVINNYKGVMLCSRPNENARQPVQKPFCGRVFNHEKIGLVPCQQQRSPIKEEKKSVPTILNRHKKWLHEFQQKQVKVKQQIEQKNKEQEQRFQRVKNIAEVDRDRAKKIRSDYNQTATNVLSILNDQPTKSAKSGQLTAANLRRLDQDNQKKKEETKEQQRKVFRKKDKKQKPIWALTEQQKQQKEQKQADDLISFFENAQIAEYSQDEQVRQILNSLKQKINQIKQKQNWKQNEKNKIDEKREQKVRERKARGEIDDDKYSNFSVNSQANSIASEKTQKKIEELRKKKAEQQQWDKHTASSKQYANLEQKIAKNLADEVLRNYPHLKGVHSNTSIRKLLEAEAAKAINEPIPRPVITTVIRDKKPLDASNLPYLHRNPAI